MTYLATPGQVSMGVGLFIGTPVMRQKFVPRKKLILAMSKCMFSMATHNAILLNGGVPTKTTISQLVLSLDSTNLGTKLKHMHRPFIIWSDMQIF